MLIVLFLICLISFVAFLLSLVIPHYFTWTLRQLQLNKKTKKFMPVIIVLQILFSSDWRKQKSTCREYKNTFILKTIYIKTIGVKNLIVIKWCSSSYPSLTKVYFFFFFTFFYCYTVVQSRSECSVLLQDFVLMKINK